MARPMARRLRATRPSQAQPRPRGALLAALALSLVGVLLSLFLARLHGQAHAGITSFCAIDDVVNCDRVATSRFSVVLGLPVAVWGVFGYALAGALAASGLTRRRVHPGWPAGLLFVVAAAAVVASVALALVSKLAIGAWCLLCAASWAVSLGLLVAAWRACRGFGVAGAARADLALARERPRSTVALALGAAAAVALVAAAYPRYWERPPRRSGPPLATSTPGPIGSATQPGSAAAPVGSVAPGGAATPADVTVVEYSDYECPYCARAHEETRAVLSGRPDVTLVRRHFPLDASCNSAVARTIHPSACALARAAICAEAQGRFAEMDDALFQNQRESLPPIKLAERLGLDIERYTACVASHQTDQRLAADVGAAVRDGVSATPTYVVGHALHAGRLPVELLPPPRRAQGTR
ncbi:MAG: hypothetical protein A2V77_10875 [Anaeromyxobacter sp. RBG_16_69_14]|nr:MAG: hypothetical protein A2V77_10875 [Anaeromyxobacter sp. RBG_16_69_14]